MLTGALATLWDWLPALAGGAGPLGAIVGGLGFVSKLAPGPRLYIRLAAIALLLVAVAGGAIHYMKLRGAAAELHEIQPKIAGLEAALGCPARPPAERDLFSCIPARDRDAEHARAQALRTQQEAADRARADLERKAAATQSDLDKANAEIEAATSADDGPVPKVMRDNWARERARRGVK